MEALSQASAAAPAPDPCVGSPVLMDGHEGP